MPIDLTTAHPSDVVVPLSDMLDLLSSRLDQNELDALSEELILRRSTQVAAGDVISAELMNQILADIDNLQTRTTVLEEGIPEVDAPQIVLVSPSDGAPIGSQLEVSGFNLAPDQLTSVLIAGRTVTTFSAASHSRLLVFDVPSILGIPPEGADVTLVVTNEFGNDSITVRVEQTIVTELSTAITLGYQAFPDEELEADTEYTVTVRVTAITSLAATYTISASFDNPGWTTEIEGGMNQLTIPSSQPTPFVQDIDVTVTTGSAGSSDFTFNIVAVGQPSENATSEALELEIGDTPAVNTEITFQPIQINAANLDASTGNIRVAAGGFVTFGVNSVLGPIGNYVVTSPVVSGDPGEFWSAALVTSPNPAANQVNENHLNAIRLDLGSGAPLATPTATVTFTVARTGSTEPPAVFTRTIEVMALLQ